MSSTNSCPFPHLLQSQALGQKAPRVWGSFLRLRPAPVSARQLEPSSIPHHLHFLQLFPPTLPSTSLSSLMATTKTLLIVPWRLRVVVCETDSQGSRNTGRAEGAGPLSKIKHPTHSAAATGSCFSVLCDSDSRWLPCGILVPIFLDGSLTH